MLFIFAFSNDEWCLLCLNDEFPLNGFAVFCWLVGDYLSMSECQAMRLPSWSKHLRNATVHKLNMSGTQQANVFFIMAEKQMSCHLYQPVPALLRDALKLCSDFREYKQYNYTVYIYICIIYAPQLGISPQILQVSILRMQNKRKTAPSLNHLCFVCALLCAQNYFSFALGFGTRLERSAAHAWPICWNIGGVLIVRIYETHSSFWRRTRSKDDFAKKPKFAKAGACEINVDKISIHASNHFWSSNSSAWRREPTSLIGPTWPTLEELDPWTTWCSTELTPPRTTASDHFGQEDQESGFRPSTGAARPDPTAVLEGQGKESQESWIKLMEVF